MECTYGLVLNDGFDRDQMLSVWGITVSKIWYRRISIKMGMTSRMLSIAFLDYWVRYSTKCTCLRGDSLHLNFCWTGAWRACNQKSTHRNSPNEVQSWFTNSQAPLWTILSGTLQCLCVIASQGSCSRYAGFINWQDPFHQEYWPIFDSSCDHHVMHHAWKRWSALNGIVYAAAHFCVKTWKFSKKLNACNGNNKGDYRIITPWFWCRLG